MATSTSTSSSAPFINVCNKELNIEDFYDIYEKMEQLSPRWKQIAISLRLKISTINRIEADCRGDTVTCLQKVLEYWLIKDYDYERYGIPCWRRVCVAVKEGGRNSALADEIAREHPLPAMPPAGSTSSKEKSATPESDEVALSPASTDRATVYVHRPEINHPLAKKIYELQDVFADALQISMESFLKKPGLLHKILNYLTMHVHALLGPIRKNNPSTVQAVREEFSDIKTMTDLFIILQDKYVSWFNYELIIKLVRVFLSDNRTLKRAWSSYEEKLKDYFINSGGLLKDADAVEFGVKGVPPGTRVMIAKVDRDDYTLDDLFFFRSAIPEECDVPHYNIYFLRVRPGSVVLEYLISEYLYSLLFPLTTKLQQQLASIGITELTCGDSEDKYDLREFSIEEVKLSSTDIDICDPLWYENTSTPLHEAAWRGLRDEVQWLLDKFGYSTYHRGLHGWTPLHSASYGGHIEILQLLIHQYGIDAWSGSTSVLSYIISQYNLNANDTDTYGCTPLVYSCRSGSINSVKYLINNHNSDPNITDKYGMTCLHHCCRLGHIEITQCLIEVQHCDINKTDNEGRTLVHHAAQSGNFDLVQYLITEQGLSPTAATKNGITALHYASVSLNLSLVKELITTYQLDPHQADSKGKLPIHYAAESGDILLLELYVKDYKCSLSLTDNEGWNVIHYSSLKGHTHFVKHITSQYPQYISLIHSTDNDGRIPLHLACNSGNIQSVTFLINDMECDVTAKETSDETCVTFACFSGNLDLVQLLIQQYKLEPLATKKSGVTALHAAAGCGHTHILEWYSQEYSVDIPNHTSNNKYTLAHLAAYEGKLHCLQELINKYQCDVNATTTTGRTVLHKACEGGHVPVVLYLTSLPQCDVAANTSNGLTALHITCGYSDSLPILKHLVENHQLDLCAVNDEGMAPIHLACLKGRQELVQYIIEHIPSSLDLPVTGYGHTPFLTAVCFNQLDVIKYLISKKCNLSATDDEGYGAVHISVEEGHLNVLKYLIDNNYCNPNATDRQDRTPLHVAVAADKFELLEYLIKSSLLNNVQDKDGDTPLHFACRRGKQKMVSLLTSSANINILITNKKGQTPLHLAVASGHKDTAEALLFSVTGSSTHHDLLTATDNEGSTVFHTACSNGHIDVFCYLCHVYPEGVKSLDANKRSLLHISCERNWMDMVKELVEKYGLLPESQDKDGITCLHLLAKEGNIKIFQYLRHHIHSNAVPRDKSGRIPLHYACLFNRNEMALYLIKSCHYNPDDPDNNGYTSVHGACEAGNFELVLYFITECGCNAQAKTKDQKTLLYYAIKSSNLEMVRFLTDVMDLNPTSIDFEAAESNSAILKHLEETRKNVKNLVEVETRDDTNNLGHFIKNMPMMIDPSRQYYIS
ncbi:PREDICTED: serine/threonine-protein phosphatase 6 regulatory ankyrin repeat subunit A-like [Amphimedon queenslandica]|uniref:Death domain-containing protein n=1 Tax=Amphimedon queenslandica TaxID=400682 RepID=A0AAN0JMH8_AMPQE|nr:PREDICTED: serine/threonine-protein phosphatase 6 regulatory ankyrin repeat subunit A-like [Amphimedon queenslandica]|eukprot:XP_019858209.1 PREDICTED: serine/threonine-protein phosphatase 6 regulatory ankyrin repeat subunit A-like [Amphimedon queenslandica]